MNKCYVCHYHLSGQAQDNFIFQKGISYLPHFTFLTRTVNHTGMSKMHAYTYNIILFEEFLVGVIAIMINI